MIPSSPPESSKPDTPIVFFGTEDFSLASLQALIAAGFSVAAVVTKPDTPRGRKRLLTPPAVKLLAEQYGIPVLQPVKLDDSFIEQIKSTVATDSSPGSASHSASLADLPPFPGVNGANTYERNGEAKDVSGGSGRSRAKLTGVLVSYGKIIPQKVLDLFPSGIINVHPSLLPKYRGPSPIEATLLNGDKKTGITLMRLVKDMDAGPVYIQSSYPLLGTETKPELYDLMAREGAQMLVEYLPAIISGQLQPVAQDDTKASYCSLLKKEDGQLLPEQKTAAKLEREIRAYLGFPKSRLSLFGHEVIVTKARVVVGEHAEAIVIACADETFLAIEQLIAPSGRTMSAAEFVRGYKK